MFTIFWAQFFMTGIILVLCNANLEYNFLSFVPLRAQFPDYTPNWYILVGPAIVQTMILMSVFPYINFLGFYSIRLGRRFADSGFGCCKKVHSTKKTTIQQYIELYSGTEF